jgi:hypothetical protein
MRLTPLALSFTFILQGCARASQGLASAGAAVTDAHGLLNRADEELLRQDVKAYATTLQQAITAAGDAADHARALAALANYRWRIAGDFDAARELLTGAGDKQPAPLIEQARMKLACDDFDGSRTAALAAIKVSVSKRDLLRARTLFARAVAQQMTAAALRGAALEPEGDSLMRSVLGMMRPYILEEPGLREPSRYALLAALWTGDGGTAMTAWESYFRLPPGSDAPVPLTSAGHTLRNLLPNLLNASLDERLEIVDALAGSRLYAESVVLADHWGLVASPRVHDLLEHDLLEYVRWTTDLRRDFDEGYRQIAAGHKVPSGRERLDARAPALWRALHSNDANYGFQRFLAEMGERFGAIFRAIPPGASYGHIIADKVLEIDQYGHRAQLRSIVLDSMISNGYTTWLWDGRAEIGGWSSDAENSQPATIVSIRGDRILSAWAELTDPEIIQRDQDNLERWTKEDDERARRDANAYLPGLALRVRLAGSRRIYDRLVAQGLHGIDLRSAFLAEYDRKFEACSIVAHEGRHALDKQSHELTLGIKLLAGAQAELEYRAKLSEVAFAPEPFICMNAIFSSNIGAKADAHGMANLRIMRGLVAWMQAHAAEIKGFDRTRPLLPQFDLLNEDQVRVAFRSMDPWAAGR